MSNQNGLIQWAPVLGTLGGAVVGFFASFVTALFTKKSDARQQKEERERRRIERIYELLIVISQVYTDQLGRAINWIHYARPIMHDEAKGIPPLIELEMLVNLYFTNLEAQREALMKAVQDFGKEYIAIQSEDFRLKDLPFRQARTGQFVTMNGEIEQEIEKFKVAVARIVKS